MNDKTIMELKLSAQFVGQSQQNICPSFQFIQNLIEVSSNPSLESLTAEVEALEVNNKQLEELSPVIDIATDFARTDPKVGDPKFNKDKKFVGSLDALSARIQNLSAREYFIFSTRCTSRNHLNPRLRLQQCLLV